MKKKLAIIISLIVLVSSVVGGTYAWFFNRVQITGSGNAALLELFVCMKSPIKFENILPGEPLDLSDNIIWYRGNRDAVIQYRLTGTGRLATGADTHKDWLALGSATLSTDYQLSADGTHYLYTDKRMNEILAAFITSANDIYNFKVYVSQRDPNTFYIHIPKERAGSVYNVAALIGLKFTGELGGMYKGSPSRQFEQSSVYEDVGIRITAVQVTPEAIEDVLGTNARLDVEDMVDQGYFTAPIEWTYTG